MHSIAMYNFTIKISELRNFSILKDHPEDDP